MNVLSDVSFLLAVAGFDWEVEEERVCDPEPKNYGDNFKYVPPQKRSIFD